MREFIRDVQQILLPEQLRQWRVDLANTTDPDAIVSEIGRIQQLIATIIKKDVINGEGLFFYGFKQPSNDEVASRLKMQCDERPFMTLEGSRPFPPKQALTEKLKKNKK